MGVSRIADMLVADYLDRRRQTEKIDQTAALLGLRGANPSAQEADMVQSMGRVDPGYAVAAPADAQGHYTLSAAKLGRQLDLQDSLDRNRDLVELYKVQAAANPGQAVSIPGLEDTLYQRGQRQARADYIRSIQDRLTPEQRIMAFDEKADLSPVRAQGGIAFNRFDTEQPILAESSAVAGSGALRQAQAGVQPSIAARNEAAARASDALAGLRGAQAGDANLRRQAIETVMGETASGPLLADIANRRPVSKPQRLKVQGANGNSYYVDAVPNLKGGYDYTPAATGETPLQAPAEAGPRPTAFASDIDKLLEVFPGMSQQEAAIYLKSDPQTRARIARKYQNAKAGPAAPAPVRKAPPGLSSDPYQQARAAIAKGADPDKVRARLQQMGLDVGRL